MAKGVWLAALVGAPGCASFSVQGDVGGEEPAFAQLLYAQTEVDGEDRLDVVLGSLGCDALGAYLDDLVDADDADEAEELWDATFESPSWEASFVRVGDLDSAIDLDLDLDDRPFGDDEASFVVRRLKGYADAEVNAVAVDGEATVSRPGAEDPLAVSIEAELEDVESGDSLGTLTVSGTATWCAALADALEDGAVEGGPDDGTTDGDGDGGGPDDPTDTDAAETDSVDTDPVDTDPVDTGTFDTDVVDTDVPDDGLFRPTGVLHEAVFGIDSLGRLGVFEVGASAFYSAWFVNLEDDKGTASPADDETCGFAYIPITQEGYDADTATGPSFPVQDLAFASWRAREGLLPGFGVWSGNHETSDLLDEAGLPCELAPEWAFLRTEAASLFLEDAGAVPQPVFVGIGDTLSAGLAASIRGSSLPQAEINRRLRQQASSYVRLPTPFTPPGGSSTRLLEMVTDGFQVDASLRAVLSGGDLVPFDASTFDAGGGRARSGIYAMRARYVLDVP